MLLYNLICAKPVNTLKEQRRVSQSQRKEERIELKPPGHTLKKLQTEEKGGVNTEV